MLHKITIDLPLCESLDVELDSSLAPNTVKTILDNLPISVIVHVWGEEIYTDPTPIVVGEENSKTGNSIYPSFFELHKPVESTLLQALPTLLRI